MTQEVEELPPIEENKVLDAPEDDAADVASVASDDTCITNLQAELAAMEKPVITKDKFRTKAQLVDEILKIDNKHSKRKLQRMRKAQLEEILGKTFNKKVHEVFEEKQESDSDDDMPDMAKPDARFPEITGYQLCELLYGFTMCTVEGVERLSKNFSHKMGGFYLDGWAQNIDSNPHLREMLKTSLYECFQENASVIMPYLTCSGRVYSILLISCLSSIKKDVV